MGCVRAGVVGMDGGWAGWLGRRGWEREVRHEALQVESREWDRVCFRALLMLLTIIIWLDYRYCVVVVTWCR